MRFGIIRWIHPAWLACGLISILSPANAAPVAVDFARDGKALLPVVVSAEASKRVRQAAQVLAEYLERMTGAPFTIMTGDGTRGLAVGRPADFPAVRIAVPFDGAITEREDYLLRSHPQGVYLLGATDMAVEYSVWDLLYRLGYRQFFPGPVWEVTPSLPLAAIAVDAYEHPDFYARRIWFQYGSWSEQNFKEWCTRNRVGLGIDIRNAHSYGDFIDRNKAEFAAHPEYYGLVDGERKSSKFCIANPGLRQLIARDAVAYLRQHPDEDSISVEPSDGDGWCECPECAKLGSISDRAVILANEVATAVELEFGDTKFVGMLAYYKHSPPPTVQVHPLVNISVATSFNNMPVNDLMLGWKAKGATLGIYEYFSVSPWWRDLPGQPHASNPDYLRESIPRFHTLGARYFNAESGDNWGVNGLGYYFASRLLWDVDEADRKEELRDDFLTKCFGLVRTPMAEFYRLIDGGNKDQQPDDLIGRMYGTLAAARRECDDPAIIARIDQLILYTHYVELFKAYQAADGAERQQSFEVLLRYVYRAGKTGIVHSLALYEDIPERDKTVTMPREANWQVPEEQNPWKSNEPFTENEILGYL